jgi:AraC-like DNA-binding protein
MAELRFDPVAMRLWRQAEAWAGDVRSVQVLLARDAPPWSQRGARWDEQGVHQHAVPTLVGCLSGVVRLITARGVLDLSEHEMCVIAPAAWHSQAALRPGSAAFGQGFLFGRSDVVLQGYGRSVTAFIPEQPSRSLMRTILATPEAGTRLPLARRLIEGFTSAATEVVTPHPAVQRMGYRMWGALDRDLSAAEVLAASGVGIRQAHRLFVAWFGMPPAQAITHQRLALAEELLREGVAIGAAAQACGFPDRRMFTRAWRRVHGHPPSQHQRRNSAG